MIGVVAGLVLLFGVRSAYNKVITEAVKPQPLPPEFFNYTPILPMGAFTPIVVVVTPTPSRGIVSGR
jgi:hypothetical protein